MTHHELISKMNLVRKWYKLTPVQQCLYHELVYISFCKRFPSKFVYSGSTLCKNLQITKRTLITARKQLSELKLITFQTSKQGKKGTYSLLATGQLPPLKSGEKYDDTDDKNYTTSGANITPYNKYLKYISINRNKKQLSFIGKQGKEGEKKLRAAFEEFRRLYPGTKRSLTTELTHFILAHEDFCQALPLLLPAMQKQLKQYNRQINYGDFVTPFPRLQKWIDDRRWEDE